MDLSKLTDEELLALRNRTAQGAADLSTLSDDELLALRNRVATDQPPRWDVDAMKALGAGVVRGVAAMPGLPGDIQKGALAAQNWANRKLGFPEAQTPPVLPLLPNQQLPTSAETVGALEAVTGPLYHAKTSPGKYAQTVGEFVPGLLVPGGVARRVIGGVLAPAIASETAAELAPAGYEGLARVGGALAGGVLGGMKAPRLGAANRAEDILTEAVTPQAKARLNELGPDAFLFEGDPTLTQIAQGVTQRPGDASNRLRTAVTDRHEAAPARLDRDVRDNFGPPISPVRVDQRISQAQRDLSVPYRAALHQSQPAEIDGILSALSADISKQAGDPKSALQTIKSFFFDGQRTKNTAGELLAIRGAIDDLYNTPKYQAQSNTLRLISEYRQAVDDALRQAAPMVKGVDAKFETLARQRDALNQGKNILATGKEAVLPSELAADIRGYTPAQQATLRIGARAEIERVLGTAIHDVNAVRGLVKSEGKWNHEKLAQIFGQTEADNVMRAVDREVAFRSAYDRLVANSQTAPRLLAEELTRVKGPGNVSPEIIAAAAGTMMTGNPAAALPAVAVTAGARRLADRIAAGGQKRLDAALVDRLGLQGPERDTALIDILARQRKGAKPNATRDMLIRAMLNAQGATVPTRTPNR